MQIQQGQITAQVDVAATRKVYATLPKVECTCCYCRNFVLASPFAPKAIQDFLHALGVDIHKPAEAICYPHPREEMLRYSGIYHAAGELAENPMETSVNLSHEWGLDPEQIRIAQNVFLVEEGFPPPIIQIEVWMDLPWVLSEARPPV